jgi:hypothetical protein
MRPRYRRLGFSLDELRTQDALKVYEGTVRIVGGFPHGVPSRESDVPGVLTARACTPAAGLPLPTK